jgi:LAGLIDADG endonuclease
MSSDNPSGGDDQQETAIPLTRVHPCWVVGFVDGEGCFSVSIHGSPYVRQTRGWQVKPVFQVSQHVRFRNVLEELASFFGCGKVRTKGPDSRVTVYAVDSMKDLAEVVLPFFEGCPLRVKYRDFEAFASIVRSMLLKEHLQPAGFERVVRLAFSMNEGGKQRSRTLEEVLAGSSETARQAPSSRPISGGW